MKELEISDLSLVVSGSPVKIAATVGAYRF